MDEDEMCPNCVTPWKCNGPHIPEGSPPGVRGWDFVENRPTLEGTFPLFEEDHGMLCEGCGRTVHRGQPYASVPTGIYENGDTTADLRCVYCAISTGGAS